jgi:uncharacterized membrane protein
MLILRLIHVLSGIFWAGATFFLVTYVSPAVQATGPEGQKFMQQMGLKSGMANALAGTASLTALSGLIMYGLISDLDIDKMSSTYLIVIGIGAIAGIAGWIVGLAVQKRSLGRMQKIAVEIESSGGPPTPEQMAEMQALSQRVGQGSRITAVLLTIAIVCMAGAQPINSLLA